MKVQSHGHEHEFEPQHGLPEVLPSNERILWQGSPEWRTLAFSVFHLRKVALYFAVLLLWHAADVAGTSASPLALLSSMAEPLALATIALAGLATLAYLTARTTVYTLTDKRLVMRVGVVLTLAFNLPLRSLGGAALRPQRDGCGDIVVTLRGSERIAYLHLWPHVRPWHLKQPQPMLRAVPDAEQVARLLTQAWAAANETVVTPRSPAADESPQWHGHAAPHAATHRALRA